MRRTLCCISLALLLPFSLSAQETTDPLVVEHEALDAEYDKAQEEWHAFLGAKEKESGGEFELTEEDRAKDPNRVFAARYRALAEKAKGTETGAQISVFLLGLERDRGAASALLAETIATYGESPAMERLAQSLVWGSWQYGQEATDAALIKLRASPVENVRAAATFAMAVVAMNGGTRDEARKLFEELKATYPQSKPAQQADSYLFELDHLQIGMKAPDFEAVDQDGIAWKLSEYLGKVVAIEYWGFW